MGLISLMAVIEHEHDFGKCAVRAVEVPRKFLSLMGPAARPVVDF
jgi:hypothetical protein